MSFLQQITFLQQKITCPFCFTAFPAKGMCFRCINPTCTGRAPDSVYAKEQGLLTAPMMGHVLATTNQSSLPSRAALCDVCKMETRTRICPSCHFELSHDVDQIDQRIIAIIGGRNTGKSHYIATLIMRLQHEVGANFQFAVRM